MPEVLIVGASLAGLTAARELRGKDVLIVDRSPVGAHQTSACALPVRIAEWLGIEDAILHADALMHISVGRERWDVRLPEAFGVIDYERACLLLAAQSDARFERGEAGRCLGEEGRPLEGPLDTRAPLPAGGDG